MKDWFFHQEKGKTLGPIATEEVKVRVREGRIRLFDLIFKEGDTQWRMALEYAELRGEFKSAAVKELKDRPWVVLQRKGVQSMDFVTSGPFTKEEIQNALQAGKVSYTDYAWRDGFAEWKRIGTIEAFNRRLKPREEEPASPPQLEPPEVPTTEMLKNVVEMKRPKLVEPEPPPPEAKLNDQPPEPPPVIKSAAPPSESTRPKATSKTPLPIPSEEEVKPKISEVTVIGSAPLDEAEEEEIEPTHVRKKKSRKRKSAIADWTIVLGLIVLVVIGGFALLRFLGEMSPDSEFPLPPVNEEQATIPEPPPAPKPPPAQSAAPPPAPPVPPADPPPAKEISVADKTPAAPPPPPRKPQPPTELYLSVQTVNSTQVRIEVRTDASPEFPVFVQIVGQVGQVADGPSFYRFLKFTPKGNGLKPVDLSGMKLPQGRFTLRVESGTLKKEAKLAVGVQEQQFKQTVARLRKVHAHSIWRERLALLRLTDLFEKKLTEALAGKRFTTRGLEQINSVNRANGGDFIMFDQWWELKDILTDAKGSPSIALVARVKRVREAMLAFSVWK